MNDAQLLVGKMIDWANDVLTDKEMIAILIPVVMDLDARVAAIENVTDFRA